MIIPSIGLGLIVRSVRGLVLVSGVGTGYARRAVFWVLLSWQLCCSIGYAAEAGPHLFSSF